jgi:hypothetical protein
MQGDRGKPTACFTWPEKSYKLQAASLTACPRDDRMINERYNMETKQLKRIADAIEEILRLVKKDMGIK